MALQISREVVDRLKDYGKDYLTRMELAHILGVHTQTIEYWNRSGKITKYKASGQYAYYVADEVRRDLLRAKRPKTKTNAPKVVHVDNGRV